MRGNDRGHTFEATADVDVRAHGRQPVGVRAVASQTATNRVPVRAIPSRETGAEHATGVVEISRDIKLPAIHEQRVRSAVEPRAQGGPAGARSPARDPRGRHRTRLAERSPDKDIKPLKRERLDASVSALIGNAPVEGVPRGAIPPRNGVDRERTRAIKAARRIKPVTGPSQRQHVAATVIETPMQPVGEWRPAGAVPTRDVLRGLPSGGQENAACNQRTVGQLDDRVDPGVAAVLQAVTEALPGAAGPLCNTPRADAADLREGAADIGFAIRQRQCRVDGLRGGNAIGQGRAEQLPVIAIPSSHALRRPATHRGELAHRDDVRACGTDVGGITQESPVQRRELRAVPFHHAQQSTAVAGGLKNPHQVNTGRPDHNLPHFVVHAVNAGHLPDTVLQDAQVRHLVGVRLGEVAADPKVSTVIGQRQHVTFLHATDDFLPRAPVPAREVLGRLITGRGELAARHHIAVRGDRNGANHRARPCKTSPQSRPRKPVPFGNVRRRHATRRGKHASRIHGTIGSHGQGGDDGIGAAVKPAAQGVPVDAVPQRHPIGKDRPGERKASRGVDLIVLRLQRVNGTIDPGGSEVRQRGPRTAVPPDKIVGGNAVGSGKRTANVEIIADPTQGMHCARRSVIGSRPQRGPGSAIPQGNLVRVQRAGIAQTVAGERTADRHGSRRGDVQCEELVV